MKKTVFRSMLSILLLISMCIPAYAEPRGFCQSANPYHKVPRARGYQVINMLLSKDYKVDEAAISESLKSGTSLSQFLSDNKIDEKKFEASYLKVRVAEVDSALKNGYITKEESESIKKELSSGSLLFKVGDSSG